MAPRLPSASLVLDRSSTVPAHVQIGSWLRSAIQTGDLVPGQRLPGERVLADQLAVSRMTLRHALADLEADGILLRQPGRAGGAFVAVPHVEVDLTELAGLTEQLRRAHRRAGARVLQVRRTTARAAGTVAQNALRLGPTSHVTLLERLRSADEMPLALERSWLPTRLVPGLAENELTGSLYDLLDRRYGLSPHSAVEELEPVLAGAAEGVLLEVAAGTPLMQVRRTAYSRDGTAVEHATDLFRTDRVRFVVRRGPAGPTAVRAEPTA